MRNLVAIILVSLILFSCDEKRIFDQYQSVAENWKKTDSVQFQFKAPDTLNKYNLFINLRNTNNYEFSNLYLIVNLKAPSHNETIDTLQYEMAKPDGEWLGTGFATKENKLFFKENVRFKEIGDYNISITHAMRKNGNVLGEENLKGITEVGFRIEKTTN